MLNSGPPAIEGLEATELHIDDRLCVASEITHPGKQLPVGGEGVTLLLPTPLAAPLYLTTSWQVGLVIELVR